MKNPKNSLIFNILQGQGGAKRQMGTFWNEQKKNFFFFLLNSSNLKNVIRAHRILRAVKLLCMIL